MTDRLAQPWHDRHKGQIIAWGLIIGLIGALGVIFRSDTWLRLAIVGNWALALFLRLGRQLGTTHGVYGWVIVVIAVSTTMLMVEGAQRGIQRVVQRSRLTEEKESDFEAFSLNATDFSVELGGLLWRGHIDEDGKIYGLQPHCPHCQFRIKPETGHRPMHHASIVTNFRCHDCEKTNKQLTGTLSAIRDIISRKIEAKWRRGELGDKAKHLPQGPQDHQDQP